MSRFRGVWLGAVLVVAVAAVPIVTGPAPRSLPRLPGEIMSRRAGQAFCPSVPLAYRSVVVAAGRCYLIAVMRDSRGMFLAFAPEDTRIKPGLVRLDTLDGRALKARLIVVPIAMYKILAPVNTLALVSTEIEDAGMHFSIKVVDTPVANLVVTFDVQV
jgi:hypothetical protein